MRFKKILHLAPAFVISLFSLLTFSVPLAYAAGPFTCTWVGSGSDSNLSTAANWSGCNGGAPAPSDADNLVFPMNSSNQAPNNDLSGASFSSITFSGTAFSQGYTIGGNAISLGSGGIDDSSTNPFGNKLNLDITATSDVDIGGADSNLTIGGTLNIGSHNLNLTNATIGLAITGTGTMNVGSGVDITSANPGFTGQVLVGAGDLTVEDAGSLANASQVTVASGGLLKGSGGLSNVTMQAGSTVAPGHSPGCLSATSMTIAGVYQAELGGTSACTDYDQIQVSNSVDVTNGDLQTSLVNGFTPTVGETFEIINNQGSSPVTGNFNGLSEGSTFISGGYTFQISYRGGDGNDVVLTVIGTGSAPATPNTGIALVAAHPFTVLAVSSAVAFIIMVVVRRLKPARQ